MNRNEQAATEPKEIKKIRGSSFQRRQRASPRTVRVDHVMVGNGFSSWTFGLLQPITEQYLPYDQDYQFNPRLLAWVKMALSVAIGRVFTCGLL